MDAGGAIHRDPIVEALTESIDTHTKLLTAALYAEQEVGESAMTVACCVDMLQSEIAHLKDRYDVLFQQSPTPISID